MDFTKRQELINKLFNKTLKFDIDALNLLNSYSLLYKNALFLYSCVFSNAMLVIQSGPHHKNILPKFIDHNVSQRFLIFDYDNDIVCIKNRYEDFGTFKNIDDYIKQCYNYTVSLNNKKDKMVST